MVESDEILGKKIIFVYPPDLVKSQLLQFLMDKEFEAYTLLNYRKIPDIHKRFPHSIFFLNIDAVQSELEWQDYIRSLNKECPGIQIGIFSFKISKKENMQFYLFELGISCGFIQLKQGVSAASEMMMKVLKANEVKGRRKFIRYQCREEDKCSLNFDFMESRVQGEIQDISSVGMSCVLSRLPDSLVKNQLIRNMQLRLRGVLVNVDAILLGTRTIESEQTLYVFLFNSDSTEKMKSKIRLFICTSLQKNFENEFSLETG
ncbi:hypothetical protein EXM22_13250 [Oceanispirochaeta crateris]|uniref:PilZ domain-containing protein n=1 Tax=Oceanispirochaeta crateris TaxID=2518645 RepID=A0A5C1QPH0_9SPIO|nr:hypothetical protein [Oceanispirochaeta crateris]QEN08910.1 hypothetical protein EXM22_13250 [Oceanispirochaeta crateris]